MNASQPPSWQTGQDGLQGFGINRQFAGRTPNQSAPSNTSKGTPPKKPKMGCGMSIVIIVIVLFVISSAGKNILGSLDVGSFLGYPEATDVLEEASFEALAEPVSLTYEGKSITINSVARGIEKIGYSEAEGEYVILECEFVNDGEDKFYPAGSTKALIDARGTPYKLDTLSTHRLEDDDDSDIDKGTLRPGESNTGYLVFDVPKDAKLNSMVFTINHLYGKVVALEVD